jgi:hypothetical protein
MYPLDSEAIARVLDGPNPSSPRDWELWQRAYCSALKIRPSKDGERLVQSYLNGFDLLNKRLSATNSLLPYAVILTRDLDRMQIIYFLDKSMDCAQLARLFAKVMGMPADSDAVRDFDRTCTSYLLDNLIKFDASTKLSKQSLMSFFFQDSLYDKSQLLDEARALSRMRSQMERWIGRGNKSKRALAEAEPVLVTTVETLAEPVVAGSALSLVDLSTLVQPSNTPMAQAMPSTISNVLSPLASISTMMMGAPSTVSLPAQRDKRMSSIPFFSPLPQASASPAV